MTVFAVIIAPETANPLLHYRAYKTLAEAQNAIRDEFGATESKSPLVYRDADYTYYYIDTLEVNL